MARSRDFAICLSRCSFEITHSGSGVGGGGTAAVDSGGAFDTGGSTVVVTSLCTSPVSDSAAASSNPGALGQHQAHRREHLLAQNWSWGSDHPRPPHPQESALCCCRQQALAATLVAHLRWTSHRRKWRAWLLQNALPWRAAALSVLQTSLCQANMAQSLRRLSRRRRHLV